MEMSRRVCARPPRRVASRGIRGPRRRRISPPARRESSRGRERRDAPCVRTLAASRRTRLVNGLVMKRDRKAPFAPSAGGPRRFAVAFDCSSDSAPCRCVFRDVRLFLNVASHPRCVSQRGARLSRVRTASFGRHAPRIPYDMSLPASRSPSPGDGAAAPGSGANFTALLAARKFRANAMTEEKREERRTAGAKLRAEPPSRPIRRTPRLLRRRSSWRA